jgi:hypothetical protein
MRSKSARNECIFCVIPGSAGCQPAVAGNLPATSNEGRKLIESSKQSRQAAETYRLAACAPQQITQTAAATVRVARASRVLAKVSHLRELSCKDCFGETRALPESSFTTRKELIGRDSVEPGRIDRSAERRPTAQCAGTMGPVSQQHVHPVIRPTSHPRDEIVLLFHPTPFSNSVDQKFRAPLSAIPAK